jgi:biopolymer transport protein ExbD
MLLVVGAAGLLAVIAGVSQLPFAGNQPAPVDPGPALALPKAEHVVVSSVDTPVVDVTATAVLIDGKHAAPRPGPAQEAPLRPVIAALHALQGSTKPNASGFRRAILRADSSTDTAVLKPVLASLHRAGYVDVVVGVQATGPCLSSTGAPLGSACQLTVDPLQRRDDAPVSYALVLHSSGYAIINNADSRTEIPFREGARDLATLRSELRTLKTLLGPRRDLDVTAESGVKYSELVTALDLALDEGFTELFLSSGGCFPRYRCFAARTQP